MAIHYDEEPAVAESFLDGLANDPELRRRYAEAGHDAHVVARIIAEHTGRDVAASNLPGIASHISQHHTDRCVEFADAYPALNFIIVQEPAGLDDVVKASLAEPV